MDASDLYAEINDDPVPDGLADAPKCEDLYRSWKYQQQEKARLLETIERLAEENKRIMRERDEIEEECNSLKKRNAVYKKNARMIFSVCRVELSKRERRIETLERRIASYGIVDGNSYSAAANSNEDDFTTQISLNLETELKFTGILSELNHGLSRNKSAREDMNSTNQNSHSDRDHPFDCRPFRGPKTPPTPSCSKPSIARTKASSAERYDRKRDSGNSSSYHNNQSKYRRYDFSDEPHEAYQKLDHRHSTDRLDDPHTYRDARERRHIRRDDNYQHEASHSEHSYGRYREVGSKDDINRSDPRMHSRNDRISDRDRERDRVYEEDRFQGRNNFYDNQYRSDYKRSVDDHCRTYDGGSDKQVLREDRESCYANGIRQNGSRHNHEGYEEYPDRRDPNREPLNHRDRFSERHNYDDIEGRSYQPSHRSHNSRRYHDDDGESGKVNLRGSVEESHSDEKSRRHETRDTRSRDRLREISESRTEHSYLAKRPEKRAIHGHEMEVEKSVSHTTDRERRPHKRLELENDDRNAALDVQQNRTSPVPYRHIKETKNDERLDDAVETQTHTPTIPSSNSSETSHELRAREKRHLYRAGNDESKSRMPTSSPNTSKSPSSIIKPSETLDGLVKSLVNNLSRMSSSDGKESATEPDNHDTNDTPIQMSPVGITKSTKAGSSIETTTRSKMRKVRESKPILFTKVKDPQKPGELESIQSSLDVSFYRDVNAYSGKEIFHRNNLKEGLPQDDFVVAEGLRIQKKESKDAEEDNFVLGSEYRKDADPDKPTESTFTKRMRERLEREEEAVANLPKIRSSHQDVPSLSKTDSTDNDQETAASTEVIERNDGAGLDNTPPVSEMEVMEEADDQQNPTDDSCVVGDSSSDGKLQQPVNGLKTSAPDKKLRKAIKEPQSHADALPCRKSAEATNRSVSSSEDMGIESTECEDYDGDVRNKLPKRTSSPRTDDKVEIQRYDEEEVVEEEGEEEEDEEEDEVAEDRRSRESGHSDYDSDGGSDHLERSPVKETIEALDWDYDDDLHLEEVDTTNVPADGDLSEGEYSADIQENTGDLEDGEMEEGEILDDSENESVSGTGTTKDADVKQKKKKRPKKTKIKKVGKTHVKASKGKKVKGPSESHNIRARRAPRSEAARVKSSVSAGKSQSGSSTRSQPPHLREQTSYRPARHLDTCTEGGVRSSRSAASRQHHATDQYETVPSHVDRRVAPSQTSSRRQRPGAQVSVVGRRDDGDRKLVRNRGKADGGLKDGSSGGYRGRSPPTRQGNCMPSKDFRSRRHVMADRHRPRR